MQQRALKSHKKQLGAQNTFFVDFGWIFVNFGWIVDNCGWIFDVILVQKKSKFKTSASRMAGLRFPNTYAIHYTLYAIRYTPYAIRYKIYAQRFAL